MYSALPKPKMILLERTPKLFVISGKQKHAFTL